MAILSARGEEWLLELVLKATGPAPIRIALNNGTAVSPPGVSPVATLLIRDLQTLLGLIADPEVGFGEGYTDGRIEVHGDLVRLLEEIYQSMSSSLTGGSWYSHLSSKWMELWQSNTPRGSRHNIHRHYDLGNDFYKLWLDPEMVYTCAYFPTRSATLEEAQTAKMEHICRKLRLQPGETVADAGCGWGALALHMARKYDVSVKAFNISHQQILFARERARAEGLDNRVEFIEDDYRNISGQFDVFVSVGMLEHLGKNHYRELGDVIHRSIGDQGRGLLHFIGRDQRKAFSRWMRKRIFPGAYIPTLGEAMDVFEPWRFSILDAENLRLHYAKTLEHWLERFEKSRRQVLEMYDERFLRAWRLYLAGSQAAFLSGTLQLFQVVFAGARCQPVYWTRAPLYARAAPAVEKVTWTHATF
ncbi:MAG TPA: cyclopropane-fatty-acyl-phospholipid synthase family protein [Bryobacteraceae bacterium]|nr:cyclopropane-fatty-acyl-phospholipid synthase family protein [Bryobacteraceae bacterium]